MQSTARSKAKASPQKSGDEAEAEKPPNRRAERPELEQSNSLQQLTELVQSLSKPTSAPALPSPPPQQPEPLQPSTEKELPHPRESDLAVGAENDLDFVGLDLQELLLQQESNQSQEFGDPEAGEAEAEADGTGSLKPADAPSRTAAEAACFFLFSFSGGVEGKPNAFVGPPQKRRPMSLAHGLAPGHPPLGRTGLRPPRRCCA